jgi:hypothetical protein
MSVQSAVLILAVVFGGAGYIIAYLILPRPETRDWHLLTISSGAGAFGVSYVLGRVLCSSSRLLSGRRGALVGVLTGILAHPVAWYLMIVWSYVSGVRSSLGERAVNPLEGLTACLVYACWSVVLTGWLTVPAGGILGWILGRTLRPR